MGTTTSKLGTAAGSGHPPGGTTAGPAGTEPFQQAGRRSPANAVWGGRRKICPTVGHAKGKGNHQTVGSRTGPAAFGTRKRVHPAGQPLFEHHQPGGLGAIPAAGREASDPFPGSHRSFPVPLGRGRHRLALLRQTAFDGVPGLPHPSQTGLQSLRRAQRPHRPHRPEI